jgi:nitrate/TMAO reductase-like tetraheme cytochrome c subunit
MPMQGSGVCIACGTADVELNDEQTCHNCHNNSMETPVETNDAPTETGDMEPPVEDSDMPSSDDTM